MKHLGKIIILTGAFILVSNFLFTKNNKKDTNIAKTVDKSAVAVGDCPQINKQHVVLMQNNVFVPNEITAKKCDELVFTNKDTNAHRVAFGEHDEHVYYDNFEEKLFQKNDTVNIVLTQTGSYRFHDHFNDNMQGELIVE